MFTSTIIAPCDKMAAGIAQSVYRPNYGLHDRGVKIRFPGGARDISLQSFQTGCEVHAASCTVDIGASFPMVKAAGA
jgi:hypothetical protein